MPHRFSLDGAAAAHVAWEVVQKLGSLSGKPGIWNEPIQIVMKEVGAGGESNVLALLWEFPEILSFPAAIRLDDQRGKYSKESNAYQWTYTSSLVDKSQLLADTVLFGDSFSDGWVRSGFTGHFSKVQRFYNWDFQKYFKNIPNGTRFVILEHCEPIIMLNHTPF